MHGGYWKKMGCVEVEGLEDKRMNRQVRDVNAFGMMMMMMMMAKLLSQVKAVG